MNVPTIRLSTHSDLDAILRFIVEMEFNPRDTVTWDGLRMIAMTAWQGEQLIGAIPLEPRVLQVGGGKMLDALHETVVAVRPEYRGGGIGSRLQQAIFDSPPNGAAVITVFREEPQCPAYRWYVRNGFSPAMRIDSWFCDEPVAEEFAPTDISLDISDPSVDWPALAAVWEANHRAVGGLINRGSRPLREWLAVHPYRGRYAFRILPLYRRGILTAYALLGIGTLHSQTTRVDVLEFCATEPGDLEADLLKSIMDSSARNGYQPVRWPLAETDPRATLAGLHHFEKRWSFDMLIRPLHGALESTDLKSGRYAGIDYA